MKQNNKLQWLKSLSLRQHIRLLLPALIAFLYNCFCYISPKFIVKESQYIYFASNMDSKVPFVPALIIIYYVSYLQWLNYYLQSSYDTDEEKKYDYYASEFIIKTICFLFFVFLPISLHRPQIDPGNSLILKWLKFTYEVDTPICLFPSVHCVYSYYSFRYNLKKNDRSACYTAILQLAFSLLVFASTVCIRQHLLIDIAGAVVFSEICIQLSVRLHLGKYYRSFCEMLFTKLGLNK